MEKVIEVRNVSYSYKGEESDTIGVKNLDFSLNRGEFVVLLGHNGSGKSTLAKLFNAFLLPDEGEVIVNGIDTKDEKRVFDIRSKVGMVFQNPDNQMVASIIEDDIAFGAENLGVERSEIRRRVDWALSAVGMTEYKDRTPTKLSGGQKQRIAIAAILAMLPEILILDESTAMLDPTGSREVLDTVKRLNKEQNMTVLLITHYMEEAIDADRIIVLKEGQIIKEGTPKSVFSDFQAIREAKLELPLATKAAKLLSDGGMAVATCLTAEELMEEICRLL